MISITFCLRRLPALTPEDFRDYWLKHHGPLVRSHKKALRIKRYEQFHGIDTPLNQAVGKARGAPEPFDGLALLTWASLEDLQAGTTDPAGREAGRALLEDERKFIDLARSPLWFNRRHVIIE